MKTCFKCTETKSEEEFNWHRKALGQRYSYCKTCWNTLNKQRYQANKSYYITKSVRSNQKQLEITRAWILIYLSTHPCVDCGEADPVVLEFDHQGNKVLAVSTMMKHALTKLQDEVTKCVVRCANCHRRKTVRDLGWYRGLVAERN